MARLRDERHDVGRRGKIKIGGLDVNGDVREVNGGRR